MLMQRDMQHGISNGQNIIVAPHRDDATSALCVLRRAKISYQNEQNTYVTTVRHPSHNAALYLHALQINRRRSVSITYIQARCESCCKILHHGDVKLRKSASREKTRNGIATVPNARRNIATVRNTSRDYQTPWWMRSCRLGLSTILPFGDPLRTQCPLRKLFFRPNTEVFVSVIKPIPDPRLP